jgi:hypothetical protein
MPRLAKTFTVIAVDLRGVMILDVPLPGIEPWMDSIQAHNAGLTPGSPRSSTSLQVTAQRPVACGQLILVWPQLRTIGQSMTSSRSMSSPEAVPCASIECDAFIGCSFLLMRSSIHLWPSSCRQIPWSAAMPDEKGCNELNMLSEVLNIAPEPSLVLCGTWGAALRHPSH